MFRKFYIAILLPLLVSSVLSATNYYVSYAGDDTNSGTSKKHPWKSLDKVNQFDFKPGDEILFKRGDKWIGSLKVKASGTNEKPIIYGAYGSGARPAISGMTTLSDWKYEGDGIYKSAVDCMKDVNLLVINGRSYRVGRYPNTGYLNYESVDSLSSIYTTELQEDMDWNDSELVIKNNNWTISRNKIIEVKKGKIEYLAATHYIPRLGDIYGFFIQRNKNTLDTFGEWYYDGTSMNVYFGENNPENYDVQTSVVDTLFNVSNHHNIVVEQIQITGANNLAVYCRGADNLVIKNSEISFSGTDAIRLQESCQNALIQDNEIIYTNGLAIEVGRTENTKIIGNLIKNTGLLPGMGHPESGYHAVSLFSKNAVVSENVIDSTGYNGISFYIDYANSCVTNNLIKHTNNLITDGSAIYMWEMNSKNISDDSGIDILDNIILHCGSNGIYTDGYVHNVRMKNNIIAFGAKGIHMNQPRYNVIEHNVLYKNSIRAISMQNLAEDQIEISAGNNVIKNNIMVGMNNPDDKIYQLSDGKGDNIFRFGMADSNYIFIPTDDYPLAVCSVRDKWNQPEGLTLNQNNWLAKMNQDVGSTIKVISPGDIELNYNVTDKRKKVKLTNTFYDINGKKYRKSIGIDSYASVILFKDKF